MVAPVEAQRTAEDEPWRRHYLILVGVAFALTGVVLALYGRDLWALLSNEAALEAAIAELGWLGPVALVVLNAAQIVIAPIPGYFMQLAAGYLYGPFWGGIWGSIGLLAGTMLAMWLSRTFGRPLVTRMVGAARLQKWESVTHSDSALLWLVLIFTPTGDLPYFLAGLSHVRYSTVFLLTLLIRVPTTFVVAAAGSGVMLLSGPQLAAAFVFLFAILFLFLRYQDRLNGWIDHQVAQQVPGRGHDVAPGETVVSDISDVPEIVDVPDIVT